MGYLKLKNTFLALVPQLAEYTGFSVAHTILEKLKIYGQAMGDLGINILSLVLSDISIQKDSLKFLQQMLQRLQKTAKNLCLRT